MQELITSSLSPTASLTLTTVTSSSYNAVSASAASVAAALKENKELSGQARSRANLIPFRKGDGRPRGHRPKGSITLRAVVDKRLQRRQAVRIVDNIIEGAQQGDDKKQDRLMVLTGDLDTKPVINISQNTLSIDANLIEAARQFLLEKNKTLPIIDAEEIKQLPKD